ncbi:MAG: hypothetical protein FJ216_10800 [Ignavibacteria bacterium]|nr:hypothetical protein [Ignavibacteria bacterium]
MKKTVNMIIEKVDSLLIGISILLIFTSFEFYDMNINGGWYQQSIPDLGGASINDITFLDSLTGFAVTNKNSSGIGYILKTSNGGDNWHVNLENSSGVLRRIIFINYDVGYVCTDYFPFLKTTNGGINWITLGAPTGFNDMSVINEDTILLVRSGGFDGGLYRTTNGGNSWHYLYDFGPSYNPNKIYMYNKDIGFVCERINNPSFTLFKTTNGGINWTWLTDNNFLDMYFVDSLTGWKVRGPIKKTKDGGLNWVTQDFPQNPQLRNDMSDISVLSRDTLFGVNGYIWLSPYTARGIVYKTTNGGLNWGYQLPDTNINIFQYFNINFATKLHGWAYLFTNGIHTTTGGSDTTIYTGIVNNYQTINDFILEQNYPNPFN